MHDLAPRIRFSMLVLAATALVSPGATAAGGDDAPFGSQADVAFANDLWTAMDGYTTWPLRSEVYPGTSPHGEFLRSYYSMVQVQGTSYHVIVKDNFGGEEATAERVAARPDDHLMAVTVMLQRDAGYDPENGDWFWVKYGPDGSVATNASGRKLAGRVAKGADQGCIACHGRAGGGDMLFIND